MPSAKPTVVHLRDVTPTPAERAVTGVTIARYVTRERCGSNLMQGVCWMQPGEESKLWSSRDSNDVGADDHWYGAVEETYFILHGSLTLTWDEGVLELGAHDSVFLAPGWTYQLRNVGDTPAMLVYSMTPSQE